MAPLRQGHAHCATIAFNLLQSIRISRVCSVLVNDRQVAELVLVYQLNLVVALRNLLVLLSRLSLNIGSLNIQLREEGLPASPFAIGATIIPCPKIVGPH